MIWSYLWPGPAELDELANDLWCYMPWFTNNKRNIYRATLAQCKMFQAQFLALCGFPYLEHNLHPIFVRLASGGGSARHRESRLLINLLS